MSLLLEARGQGAECAGEEPPNAKGAMGRQVYAASIGSLECPQPDGAVHAKRSSSTLRDVNAHTRGGHVTGVSVASPQRQESSRK